MAKNINTTVTEEEQNTTATEPVQENVTAAETKQSRTLEKILENTELIKTDLVIKREAFKELENGTKYFSYFIERQGNTRKLKANIIPHDHGGYGMLDEIYFDTDNVKLGVKPYSMTDDKGITSSGLTYEVYTEFESFPIKPANRSDKALLEKLIKMELMNK